MRADKTDLDLWGELVEPGDLRILANQLGVTKPTVSKILKSGHGKSSHVVKIIKFYRKRNELLKSVQNN